MSSKPKPNLQSTTASDLPNARATLPTTNPTNPTVSTTPVTPGTHNQVLLNSPMKEVSDSYLASLQQSRLGREHANERQSQQQQVESTQSDLLQRVLQRMDMRDQEMQQYKHQQADIQMQLQHIKNKIYTPANTFSSKTLEEQYDNFRKSGGDLCIDQYFPKIKGADFEREFGTAPGPSEKKHIQEFWTSITDRLHVYANAKAQADLKPNKREAPKFRFYDTHKTLVLEGLKPDQVLAPIGCTPAAYNILAVGDFKSSPKSAGVNEFSLKHKAKLAHYTTKLLELNPHRTMVFGWLINKTKIKFTRTFRSNDDDICIDESGEHPIAEYGGYLLSLCCASYEDLGQPQDAFKLGGKLLLCKQYIARGGTSHVFHVESQSGDAMIAKVFQKGQLRRVELEKDNLQKLVGYCYEDRKHLSDPVIGIVPELKGSNQSTLYLKPIGEHFAKSARECDILPVLTSDDLCAMIDLLESIHKSPAKLTHRDLSMLNVFRFRCSGKIYLLINDWGCGAIIDEWSSFEGALWLAPIAVLEALEGEGRRNSLYQPKAWHDLEMLVHLLYTRMNYVFLEPNKQDDVTQIREFWEAAMKPWHWQAAINAARRTSYEDLKEQIKKFL